MVEKCTMIFSSLCFMRYCISSVNSLLNFLSYQNSGKKLRYIFSNITYDVLYYLTKFDIKTQLINLHVQKKKILLRGKLDQLK